MDTWLCARMFYTKDGGIVRVSVDLNGMNNASGGGRSNDCGDWRVISDGHV